MSRHLQILPILRSTAAAVTKVRHPAAGKENDEINIEQKNKVVELEICGENYLNLKIDVEIGSTSTSSCVTPKSDKNKIPKILDCPPPPAPKKPIRRIGCVSCKRKLMAELEFFEVDKRKEVDEFIKSSFDRISYTNGRKRRFSNTTGDANHSVSTRSSSNV